MIEWYTFLYIYIHIYIYVHLYLYLYLYLYLDVDVDVYVKMFQAENRNSVPTACSEAHTSVIHFTFSESTPEGDDVEELYLTVLLSSQRFLCKNLTVVT